MNICELTSNLRPTLKKIFILKSTLHDYFQEDNPLPLQHRYVSFLGHHERMLDQHLEFVLDNPNLGLWDDL